MHSLSETLKLPLENPVLIFSLVLFIILFAPLVLNRLRIPPIIGLIIAGTVIGPHGLNLMLRDASVVLFGTVGLLYIMFVAGLELDLEEFHKTRHRSLVFGLLTFAVPMAVGTLVSYHGLGYSMLSSVLLASMFASHTLIAYPIASRFGVAKNRAVQITVGGTIITDALALLVLAVVVGMVDGDIGGAFWARLAGSLTLFALLVLVGVPLVARWFFKREDDSVSQYIFVLATVFLAAFLAQLAGVEPIIGAFAAGIALNRLIPRMSPLMNRIEFVGNALFIPFFLIGVGMLVDLRVFFSGAETLRVALVMTAVATACKLIPAWLAKQAFRLTRDEFLMMFGLSNAQAAATLAAVLVGYNIELETLPDGTVVRLLGEDVLNGTLVMILVTCTLASFTTARAAARLAPLEALRAEEPDAEARRTLVSLAGVASVEPLIELAVLMRGPKSRERLLALHVVDEHGTGEEEARGRKLLERAVVQAAASDIALEPLVRHDTNVASGLVFALREQRIDEVVLGATREGAECAAPFGTLTESLLERTHRTVFMYGAMQPLGTIRRVVVVVPPRAEYESGFVRWFERVSALARQIGSALVFHGPATTLARLRVLCGSSRRPVAASFVELDGWDDFLIVGRELGGDDLLVVVSARPGSVSYDPLFAKLPRQLARYFGRNGYLVVFPERLGDDELDRSDLDPSMTGVLEDGVQRIDRAGRFVRRIFRRGDGAGPGR